MVSPLSKESVYNFYTLFHFYRLLVTVGNVAEFFAIALMKKQMRIWASHKYEERQALHLK